MCKWAFNSLLCVRVSLGNLLEGVFVRGQMSHSQGRMPYFHKTQSLRQIDKQTRRSDNRTSPFVVFV